jgi:hypothetical protein
MTQVSVIAVSVERDGTAQPGARTYFRDAAAAERR